MKVGGGRPVEVEDGRLVEVGGGRSGEMEGIKPAEVGARLRVVKVLGRDDSSVGRNHTYDVFPESQGKGLLLTEIEVHWRAPVQATATVTSSNLQNIVSHIMAELALLM